DQIQNATAIELYQLFELYSIRLYEPLLSLTNQFNNTIRKLIELSRNTTYFRFQDDYHSSVESFFNNLLTVNYKNYQYDIQNHVDDFFRQILRISMEPDSENQARLSTYLVCLWRNHPFGNRPNVIAKQIEANLGKLLHLNELLKLSLELVQFMSMSVTTDNHCVESYIQLTYCNLCSGRTELPCLSNCIHTIESCLVNISLINDLWMNFIDSLDSIDYFNGVEKVFSTISTSIFDAVMTFLKSDGISNQDIIDQCGSVPMRKEIFDRNQKFQDEYHTSLSLLDEQLMSMKQSLKMYRSFWLGLPEEICQTKGISTSNENLCWTGTTISNEKRSQPIVNNYDKPLNLRLQWILKEIREKSQTLRNKKDLPLDNLTQTSTNRTLEDVVKLNLPDDLDDYPNNDELHYSDYAYEDSPDESTSSTTIRMTSTASLDDDTLIDDMNTVSYYDYAEQDLYSDEHVDISSTRPASSNNSTISKPIPSHHQRQPIIWNINIDKETSTERSTPQSNSCISLHHFSLFFFVLLVSLLFQF
ncbi:unnamed protein product, partial [Adineta ricciae]